MATNNFISRSGRKSVVAGDGQGILISKGLRLQLDSDVSYLKGDIIEHDGALWKANSDISTMANGIVGGTDSDQWTQLSGQSEPEILRSYAIDQYSSAVEYFEGDVVIYEGTLYAATSYIPAGTTFVVGYETQQWQPVSGSEYLAGDFVETWPVGDGTGWDVTSTYSAVFDGDMNVTIPSTGKYRVNAQFFAGLTTTTDGNSIVGFSINGATPTTENSQTVLYYGTGSAHVNIERYLDLQAGDVVQLWAEENGGTFRIYDIEDEYRLPNISALKVADFLPAIGSMGNYLSLKPNGNKTLSFNTEISGWNVIDQAGSMTVSGSRITLTGGKSYNINVVLGGIVTSASGENTISIRDVTNGANIGTSAVFKASSSTSDYVGNNVINFTYTPTSTIQIALYANSVVATSTLVAAWTSFEVREVGELSPIYKDYQPSLLKAYRPANQNGLDVNDAIIFNNTQLSVGPGIALDTSTGQITLSAGKTYRVRASAGNGLTTGVPATFALYDDTNSSYFPATEQNLMAPAENESRSVVSSGIEHFIECDVETTISVRLKAASSTISIGGSNDAGVQGDPWITVEAVTKRLPTMTTTRLENMTNVSVSVSDVIPRGAALRCFDGTNWEVDSWESDPIPLSTNSADEWEDQFGWRWGFWATGNDRPFVRNNTGRSYAVTSVAYKAYMNDTNQGFDGESNGSSALANGDFIYFMDANIFDGEGDTMFGKFNFATNTTQMKNGNFVSIEFMGVVDQAATNTIKFFFRRLR